MGKSKLQYRVSSAHRTKHKERWNQPEAGWVRDMDGYRVGKCPKDMDETTAAELLEDGIRVAGRQRRSPQPQDVYNVHAGVPYRAHLTLPGYHGFPEDPRRIPPEVLEQLEARIHQDGDWELYERWKEACADDDA